MELIENLGAVGTFLGGIAAIIAALKGLIDALRAKKARPGDIVSQRREAVSHLGEKTEDDPAGTFKYKVSSGRLIIRMLFLWVLGASLFFGTIYYSNLVNRLDDMILYAVFISVGILFVVSLIYLFRLVYRAVVFVFLR